MSHSVGVDLMPPKPGYVAPSREGKVPLTIYVEPETRQALKIAAVVNQTTVDAMMQEAITATLKKYQAKSKS